MSKLTPTPGQTVGPFYGYALPFNKDNELLAPGSPGSIRLQGTVYDGAGNTIPDAILEIWQPDSEGNIVQRTGSLVRDGYTFTGWGRGAVGNTGVFTFTTVNPGPTSPGAAPSISVAVFARGLMNRLFTRIYLPENEEALANDPLLSSLPEGRRKTLIARRDPDGGLTWDLRLQGEDETVFLDFEGNVHRDGLIPVSSYSGGDFGLLSPVTASPAVAALSGDGAVLAAILDVEAAWAAVLEEAGLAPAGAAAVVAQAADPALYDPAAIAERGQGGGNPVIPLLGELRGRVRSADPAALAAVHSSLTSQDVLDSALMVLASRVRAAVLSEVKGTTTALAALAGQHADTLCVGRSLSQHALPYTFGLKAAQWFQGVAAAARRLESLELPLQSGGAGGTLASGTVLTADASFGPFELADALAAKLGLAAAPAPWHTNRLAVTGLGDSLAALTDSFGKIAADLLFLSRPEVAELGEPLAAGRGVSSAMPQKQNPVLSVLIRSAALQAPAFASQLHLAAATFNDERPDGAWHVEWPALRSLLALTLGAATQLRELAEGLRVFPEAMRRNLELSGPLLLSEGVSAAVAPLLGTDGKQKLQAVVDRVLEVPAAGQAGVYAKLLREAVPAELLSDARLAELLDPANYLGEAAEISRRILAAYPDYSSTTSPTAPAKGHPNG